MEMTKETVHKTVNEPLGTRIKQLRIKRRVSVEELAEFTGKSAVTIKNYEYNHREPNLETVRMIADRLNTSSDYLLGMTDIADRTIPTDFDELLERTNLNRTGLNDYQQKQLRQRLKETKDAFILYLKHA